MSYRLLRQSSRLYRPVLGTRPIMPSYTHLIHKQKPIFQTQFLTVSPRMLHICTVDLNKERSKVAETVQQLEEQKEKTTQVVPKRTMIKKVKDVIIHFYHGFRLLFIDVQVASRYVLKMFRGIELSRREHKQLIRTTSDLFRLVPFSVFVIVPFMELLLPFFLKLFPGMLPSTFQTVSEKEAKSLKQLKVKLEMAKFLQDTLDEMALQSRGDQHSHTAKDFAQFFERIRTSGNQATNEEIIRFSKLFEDEITLDNLLRPQLIAICRILGLQPIGTTNFLRFQLRMKLRSLNADDKIIQKEGINSLNDNELQNACRDRGMRALGLTKDRLRSQLKQWLELSLDKQIPPSLLLLSRALYVSETLPAPEQLKATISTLSETTLNETKYTIGEKEGKVDNKTKIELIKKEEEEIKKEQQEEIKSIEEDKKAEEVQNPELFQEEIDLAKQQAILEAVQASGRKDPNVKEDNASMNKADLSKEDFEDLEDAMEKISIEKKQLMIEKEELADLKEEMAEYKEDIEHFKELTTESGTKGLKESKGAKRLYNKVNKMISNMDTLISDLDKSKQAAIKENGLKDKDGAPMDQEKDDIVNINELMRMISKNQKISDGAKLQKIKDVLDRIDGDADGAVEVETVLKITELLGEDNIKISQNQMNEIVDLLHKEEVLEQIESFEKDNNKPPPAQ